MTSWCFWDIVVDACVPWTVAIAWIGPSRCREIWSATSIPSTIRPVGLVRENYYYPADTAAGIWLQVQQILLLPGEMAREVRICAGRDGKGQVARADARSRLFPN